MIVFALLVSFGVCVVLNEAYAETPDNSEAEYWKPPGELINVGSYRLHVFCMGPQQDTPGRVNPTVVIDSGLGGFSLEWRRVQTLLADEFRVCAYDRAGYGWSDPGPFPRTTKTIVSELKLLLTNANIYAPYILVGHSFGGYNMMYFAKKYPSDVAGLVLIDSSHPEQSVWFPTAFSDLKRLSSRQRLVSIPKVPDNYPDGMRVLGFHLMNTRKARRTLLFESMNFEISGRQVASMGILPQIPMAILTRGERAWPDTAEGELNETNWVRLQNELARIVKGSTHVMADFSGHFIHLDQPLLVENAVNEIADRFHCSQQQNKAIYAQLKNEVKQMTGIINVASANQYIDQQDECMYE